MSPRAKIIAENNARALLDYILYSLPFAYSRQKKNALNGRNDKILIILP